MEMDRTYIHNEKKLPERNKGLPKRRKEFIKKVYS